MSKVEYPPIPANNPFPTEVPNSEQPTGLPMNGLKAGGVAVVVFVVWCIGAFFLVSTQHMGEIYDPTLGMWFVDHSPAAQSAMAIWTGQAVFFGAAVALIAGVIFFFRKGLARFAR
jgi:hypothetical protein